MDNTQNVDFLKEISNFIFTSKYAKFDKDLNRRETWDETVDRVQNMHLKKFRLLPKEDREKIKWAFSLVKEKTVIPSMRSMQFGGRAVEAHNARMFNCAVKHVDSIRSFAEIFYLLLCGNGVGIGLSEKFLNRLPDLVSAKNKTGTVITYVIEDTIEGWADSLEALLSCYFKNTAYTGRKIVFDFSKIRPEGSPLKTGGGKAPGFKGLKNCHKKIKALLDYIIEEEGVSRLRSIHAYDILMHSADAVLSGGVRRSATSIIFQKDDVEMLNAKTNFKISKKSRFSLDEETNFWHGKVTVNKKIYDVTISDYEYKNLCDNHEISWTHIEPQRARSNNSVLLIRNETTEKEFYDIIEKTKQWGEPGFVFADDKDQLFNPCFTIDTKILTEDGWKPFGDLLNKTLNIVQDSRVKGYLDNNEEKWNIDLSKKGTVINKASNIRKTASNQDIYKITSTCGREVKTTNNHLFATPKGMKTTQELSVGDNILIALPNAYLPNKEDVNYKSGFISGLIFGDGCVSNNALIVDLWEDVDPQGNIRLIENIINELCQEDLINQKTHKNLPTFNKCVETDNYIKYRLSSASLKRVLDKFNFSKGDLDWIHKNDKNFKSGFLAGLFYADGHVDFNDKSKSISLRITSIDFKSLQNLQLILQELGIFSKINNLLPQRETLMPNGKGGMKLYNCKPSFRLIIGEKNNCKNASNILFNFKTEKTKKFFEILKSLASNCKNYNKYATVKSIEYIGKEDVYCLSEDVNRTLIAEGFTAKRCFEISFLPVTEDGVSGVQFCNLSSINGARINSKNKFLEAVEAATIIGTLQASYTHFEYLNNSSKKLTDEEALLGVSITGMMDNPDILLDEKNQAEGANLAKKINLEWSSKIKIKPAARITCIKPEGTSSLVLGSASGIHPHHSRRYFRRVQCNKHDNIYKFFKKHNPHAVEESVWSANKTDDVITFPIQISQAAMVKSDLSALKHLEIIKKTQINWVNNGTTDFNKKPLIHNVSCTVIVKDEEWDEVKSYIYKNKQYFCAVSLLSFIGDKAYKQAPMESVITEEDEKKWAALVQGYTPVDYKNLEELDDETTHAQELSCAGGNCLI